MGAAMSTAPVYGASPANRRATQAEMEERAEFLIAYAEQYGPVTSRQLYYQSVVHGLPGIEKDDRGYDKIQRQVLNLRREGRLDYDWIADATRWMRKPTSFDGPEQALDHWSRFYRKDLWADAPDYVEVWCEKDALAGVIYPVTAKYDVPLMVSRGFASETFCYEAIAQRGGDRRNYYVYYLGDFDRSGQDAARSLKEKLTRFADEEDIIVFFYTLAITERQVRTYKLPTRPHKRNTPADRAWPHKFACELDAMAPDHIRELVEDAINYHLDQEKLRILQIAEASEREGLIALARGRKPKPKRKPKTTRAKR
jgi:CRISPR/Cas system-associated endoribonuclease Cas2